MDFQKGNKVEECEKGRRTACMITITKSWTELPKLSRNAGFSPESEHRDVVFFLHLQDFLIYIPIEYSHP